ncbi:hypothetical protein ACE3MS_00170 [Paenibacillus dendritiformis]|uniref:hypothetical protein n=1 Tax=Paenibacillus dendritiformis TaxID=130049 RepID=UPI00364BD97A
MSLSWNVKIAGCGGWYEPVDKDTVMAHKIGPAQAKKRLAYPGTLVEDAVKTLSVKAVNTYFGADLTLEDTRIELETFDPDQVRSWLKELKGDEALLDDEYNTQLSDLPSGVNTAILINRHDPSIHYIVSLNASDGDILDLRQYSGYRSGSTGGGALGKHKAGAIARQFLERGGAVNWSELEWREYPVNGEEYTLLCYRHKQFPCHQVYCGDRYPHERGIQFQQRHYGRDIIFFSGDFKSNVFYANVARGDFGASPHLEEDEGLFFFGEILQLDYNFT